MTTLEEIVACTRQVVAGRVQECPLADLEASIAARTEPLDFTAALRGPGVSLIAEVKKASPSRGIIRADFHPRELAETYVASGAAAVSVLTEPRYFLGSPEHLSDIAASPLAHSVPLLRKDFILDPYQVYEARTLGADAVLLIVAVLEPARLRALLVLSHDLGMKCLVEAHSEQEVEAAVDSGAAVIGINNRDLHTFRVDLSTFERLRPAVPPGRLVVAESGIWSAADVQRLASAGADAVLVGEALLTGGDVSARVRELSCVT
jgi:indole-3-glycerol phosphate synthase